MNEPAAASNIENNPGDPPPIEQLSPVFAGGDPIEEENQGAVEDLHEGITPQSDVAPPNTDPAATPPAAEQTGDTGAEPPPAEGLAAQEDTPPPSEPVANQEQQEPAAEPPQAAAAQDGDAGVEVPPAQDGVAAEPDAGNVPSFRLAQEAARRRAAEARATEMEEQARYYRQQAQQQNEAPPPQQPQAPAPEAGVPPAAQPSLDLGDNPKQMFDKVLDGDLDKATELFQDMMKQAVATNAQQPQQQQLDPQQLDQMVGQRIEAARLRDQELGVIKNLEATIPQLNPQNKDVFDNALVDEILALKETYVNMKFTPAEAMERASAMVLNANGMGGPLAETGAPPPPANTPEATKQAVKRNVAAQNQQPPELPQGASPQAPPEIDVMKLSEDEFGALPEATLARLRGDYG